MADGSTTTYSFTLPEVGASEDTWGTKLNANWTSVDGLLDGTTAIAPNLSTLTINGTAVTATAAELNALDGITADVTELNYTDGVTSAIQTQLDGKAALAGSGSQAFSASTLNATTVDLGDWTITESAGVLYFATGGTDKMKLDASGNLTVVGDVTAFGTV